MAEENVIRKLAAILYADVAGYSRLTGVDEIGTHRQLTGLGGFLSDNDRSTGYLGRQEQPADLLPSLAKLAIMAI